MLRSILSFFGAIFSWFVTASFFIALTVGAIFWIYSRDLPSHETLAQYTPKTISRIYSGEGRLIDELPSGRANRPSSRVRDRFGRLRDTLCAVISRRHAFPSLRQTQKGTG